LNRALLIALVVLLSLTLAWVVLFWKPEPGSRGLPKSLELAEAPGGGDFTLQSHKGSVSLQSLRGKVVALYFGYTMCPDVCPTSLGYLSMALNELSPGELSTVQGLFISVDPERYRQDSQTVPRS